jgi:hypothetical protein
MEQRILREEETGRDYRRHADSLSIRVIFLGRIAAGRVSETAVERGRAAGQ